MITISFYSYKGGVGRSLAIANLGVYLSQFGATVAMIDLDLEAPGMHYKLPPGSEPIQVPNRGISGLLAEVTRSSSPDTADYDLALDVTDRVRADVTPEVESDQPQGRLLIVPAGNPLDQQYWRDVSEIDWYALFASKPRVGVTALSRLRQRLVERFDPDVLLVDSRTGITASGGVATTLLPDVVVTFLLDTPEHLEGLRVVTSAILTESGSDSPKRVVPVLSRYTSASIAEERGVRERLVRAGGSVRVRAVPSAPPEEEIPLEGIRQALITGLPPEVASRVEMPFVLHTDLALQRSEHLSFGTRLGAGSGTEGGLLDDYLRLFSNLVPREMVTRYVSGVRTRVRAIILDHPDDAVRTLENLATLVGDEGVFVDLVKAHVLRQDARSMLRTADRLYRVHGRIVVDAAITEALEEMLAGRRVAVRQVPLSTEFVEAYWRAASSDPGLGVNVAQFLAMEGVLERAENLAEELVSAEEDPEVLAQLVEAMALGNDDCERLAVKVALDHFGLGADSPDFLSSAARAAIYQENSQLAQLIVEAPSFLSIPNTLAVEMLRYSGRLDDAGARIVETLSGLSPESQEIDELSETWFFLQARNWELRGELEQRNPEVVDSLEALRDDRPRPARDRVRHRRR